MAYLYVNADGVTRPYSTINDALATASGGDTIVIDPGTYPERVDLTEEINIRGNTNTPENDDIIIRYSSLPLRILHTLTSSETIHIEGVTLDTYAAPNYGSVFSVTGQGSERYLNLIFNRCRFLMYGTSNNQCALDLNSTYANNLWLDHCEWDITTANPKYEYIEAVWGSINDSRILACVYEGTYGNYSGSGTPTIHNYVTTPTEGYGPAYSSDWYVELDYPVVGYFDGYVTEEGSPVQRTVNLYKRTNGEFLGTTNSNASGYYYIETTYSGLHYIVAVDDPADPLYNDLIIGSVAPTSI